MVPAHRISRRIFGAGLVLSVPAVLNRDNASAQTSPPTATPSGSENALVAVTPYQLFDTLLATPFDVGSSMLGARFEQARWPDLQSTPYITSVGGVLIRRANGAGGPHDQVLGTYSVYLKPDGALAGQQLVELDLADTTIEEFPLSIAHLKGKTIVYGGDNRKVLSIVVAGNVLIAAHDIGIVEGERDHDRGRTASFRSVRHATILLDHLERIINRQT